MSRLPATFKVFMLALAVYGFSSQVWSHATSLAPYYVYLAQSLLQRHVDLIQLPPTTYDLLQANGKWFVAGSPLPSIMMLPFVALFGTSFSDVLFSVVVGALDVALVYSLLGGFINHGDTEAPRTDGKTQWLSVSVVISESARRWITLLFAIGTPFWYLAALGTYWFTAHVVVVFFALLATREALLKQRWFLVGLWLACAGFARPTALFLAPFFLIIMFHETRTAPRRSSITHRLSHNLLPFALALTLGLGAHFFYNYARFKSFTDFGYAHVIGAPNITSVYARYGGFNPRFLPCNLVVSLAAPPEVNGTVPAFIEQACAYLLEGVKLSDTSALIVPNPLGMSIFLATPALLIVFAPLAAYLKQRLKRDRSALDSTSFRFTKHPSRAGSDPLIIAAWVGLFATLIPLWLYHNTGSLQFGYRYLFDAAPLWIILLAAGMQKVTDLKRGLMLASVVINGWGFLWAFEKFNGVVWWKF